jgi:hypothetical protein
MLDAADGFLCLSGRLWLCTCPCSKYKVEEFDFGGREAFLASIWIRRAWRVIRMRHSSTFSSSNTDLLSKKARREARCSFVPGISLLYRVRCPNAPIVGGHVPERLGAPFGREEENENERSVQILEGEEGLDWWAM